MNLAHHPWLRAGRGIKHFVASTLILLVFTSKSSAETIQSIYVPIAVKPCPLASIPTSDNWLDYLNFYRATACLPPVVENAIWSDGAYKHSIYIVKNDELLHSEDPYNPWYTPEGQNAAEQSNLAAAHEMPLSLYPAGPCLLAQPKKPLSRSMA